MTKGKKQQKKQAKPAKQLVQAPLAVGCARKSSPPKYGRSSNGTFPVHRRELVCGLSHTGSSVFTIDPKSASMPGFDLNPSTSTMFPWLSSMAVNFERYKFNKISFEVVPSQAATSAGRYYLAVDYDFDDPVPSTKAQLMSNRTAAEAPVWQPLKIDCPHALLHEEMPYRYCAHSGRVTYVEPRTAFCGYLIIGYDAPAACSFDLWVEYDVELTTPCVEGPTVFDSMVLLTDPVADSGLTAVVGAANVHPAFQTGATTFRGGPAEAPAKVLFGPAIPQLLQPYHTSAVNDTAATCLDLKDCPAKGILEIMSAFTETGVTPATVMGKQPRMELTGYRSDGSRIGNTAEGTLDIGCANTMQNSAQTTGPANPGNIGVLGGQLVSRVLAKLNVLMADQAVRYLVPYLTATAAVGAGTVKDGFRLSI